MINFYLNSSAEVQAAIISVIGTLLTTLIASITAALIGKQFANRKKLIERLHLALDDIEFLLAVEQEHCENNRLQLSNTYKLIMREKARELGWRWSAKHSLSKIAALRRALPRANQNQKNSE